MAYSLEAVLLVPLTLGMLVFGIYSSADAYADLSRDKEREASQDHFRKAGTQPVYEVVLDEAGNLADVKTNPQALLRFCISLEDQGGLLRDYLPGQAVTSE